jgi:hypothetical protein
VPFPFADILARPVPIDLRKDRQGDLGELMFVRVADHDGYARQRRNFFGSPLRVASRDDNFCQRVLAAHAADGSTGILIGRVRDGTGIQYDQFGFVGCSAGEAADFELAFEGSAVSLGGSATEVFDVVSGHGTIVAQVKDEWGPNTYVRLFLAGAAGGGSDFTGESCF